jgi:ribosomal protein L11
LAHVPMEERDSDAIAKLTMDVLQRYRLEARVQFVITGTAKVMSCAVKKKLDRIW